MAIPTEPIGSIPRPAPLIEAGHDLAAGRITAGDYARLAEAAVRETVEQLEEPDRPRVLRAIAKHARPGHRIFVGVIDPIDPRIETAEEVRDRVLEAAEYLGPARLGTCDDCGFVPFGDDTSTARETAFEKIRARVAGTRLAAAQLGL